MMLQNLFEKLSHAIEGTPLVAVSAAVIWGILSIILSPCHLASIPLIVGFIDKQGSISTKRAFVISFLFSIGILITIGFIGVVTAVAGRMMGDVGPWGNYFVSAIFIIVGLYLMDVIKLPMPSAAQPGINRKGMLAAFLLGLIFGIALGPCTFAYMAPMLAVTFRMAAERMMYGILLLFAYGVGHCAMIVFAGTFTEIIQRYLDWNEKSKGALILKRICGAMVILAGLYLIYIA